MSIYKNDKCIAIDEAIMKELIGESMPEFITIDGVKYKGTYDKESDTWNFVPMLYRHDISFVLNALNGDAEPSYTYTTSVTNGDENPLTITTAFQNINNITLDTIGTGTFYTDHLNLYILNKSYIGFYVKEIITSLLVRLYIYNDIADSDYLATDYDVTTVMSTTPRTLNFYINNFSDAVVQV